MKVIKPIKFAGVSMLSGLVSCTIAGAALAATPASDTTATIGGTSNDTNNTVTVSNTSTTTLTDNSTTKVDNYTDQDVKSGSVSLSDVASGGNLTSGNASATSVTTTTINQPGMGSGSGNGGGSGSGSGGGSGSGNGGGSVGGMGGGSGSGSGGTSNITFGRGAGSGVITTAATLPDTGASVPVDVSALRALYHAPSTQSPVAAAAKQAGLFSGAILGVASLLSLLGATGSAIYAHRRQQKA